MSLEDIESVPSNYVSNCSISLRLYDADRVVTDA